ncbi:Rgp1-domain-containing protein [Zychaea mexicana]|uniref:Rgp1-domain-containing protein n=1 Tax=Zychaea mexicana TaxID=64656 RepID=UPI0022FE49E8|nr:Rgp1-domain-containing protein [Zychaea mexicana]KAI9497852.1 Rgp1-domain-containing protein [Zychaea mexicana]
MSVLVTTTFSQGAVFYAGETVSCTIEFSNPLPTLPKAPSASSSSSSSYSRRSSTRFHQPSPRHLQGNGGHSRSHSLNSASDISVTSSGKPSSSSPPSQQPQQPQQWERQTKSASREVEGLALLTGSTTKSATTSLTSLASSTFSFFTGNYKQDQQSTRQDGQRETRWDAPQSGEQGTMIAMQDETVGNPAGGEPISIELGDTLTPRSSIDTQSIREPYLDASRRSSVDSLASNHPYHTAARASQLSAPRLSQFLLRSSSAPSLVKKPEHLLWGFAQVVGNFIVDPSLINNNEFAPLKRRTMYRPHGSGMGGGGGLLMGKPDAHSKIDTRTTPVISTPPSILFVDLDLAPGETKKFSYKLKLPNDIPPSHRGKAIRFTYSLVVGTQRSNSSPSNGQGQVVQIPFRVLNHVSEDGSRPIYDLMNPVVMYKDEAIVEAFSEEDFKKAKLSMRRTSSKAASDKARSDFLDYVNELSAHSSENESFSEITRRESDAYDEPTAEQKQDDDDTAEKRMFGRACAQIVSRITNSSRKAMFDICKSNQRVAQLHMTKTAYRLGEAVLGVLDFEHAILPTYEVSILLESNEIIESDIALRPAQQITRISRKCYAEHHSFCLSHRRLAFSLPIPSIASPEFQTTGVKLQYYLKFEFIVTQKPAANPDTTTSTTANHSSPSSSSSNSTTATSSIPASYIPINVDERHRHFQSAQDVDVSTFDCQIPIRVYGSPGGTDRAVYGRPYTFLVQ